MLLAVALSPSHLCGHEVDYHWLPHSSWPPTLRDIAGRLPANTEARDDDLITYAHEGSHFLCKGGEGRHGVYILQGRRHWIPTPPIPTARVFAAVPEEHRTSIHKIYLRQASDPYWVAQPLMILDEWAAYTHGCMVRKELQLKTRLETELHCMTFARYAQVLHQLSKQCENYDATELTKFCRWNLDRCRATIADFDTLCDVTFD